MHLLAIPQLAYDIAGAPADMNGGDSDTELLLLRRNNSRYEPFQTLSAPGGEDAEFFRIGERAFLAVASIRSGRGPYRFATDSAVFEWDGERFTPFQLMPSYAAKQWRHFEIGRLHFLALAQGVVLPGQEDANRPSVIYRWDGARFAPFQEVPGRWAYNWHAFDIDGTHYLAHADHLDPSVLYRWDGAAFVPHQELADRHGRAFADFRAGGDTYLLVARLQSESELLRWDGSRFFPHKKLDGLGAREFALIETAAGLYVVRVNFVLGTPAAPTTALESEIYRFDGSELNAVYRFPTTGGTDVATIHGDNGQLLVAVSNSLTAGVRFAARTALYRFGI